MKWVSRSLSKIGLDAVPAVRRLIVAVIGVTILLIGLALVVLPGPAFVVVPVGLAILASEFAWARRLIRRGRVLIEQTKRSAPLAAIGIRDDDEHA
jgi:tellurite resistance protein TerC